jgi:hypothetical protein
MVVAPLGYEGSGSNESFFAPDRGVKRLPMCNGDLKEWLIQNESIPTAERASGALTTR